MGEVSIIMNGISVSLYEERLPPSIWQELDRLHESLYSSAAMFRTAAAADGIRACIAREGGVPRAIFLFRQEGSRVEVLNEMIEVETRWINAFTACVFDRYRDVRLVSLRGVRTDAGDIERLHQRVPFANDVVLELPHSEASFRAVLGRSTRENLKRNHKAIQRDFPSFQLRVADGGDAGSDAGIRRIMALGRARLASKGKVSGITDKEQERIVALAHEYGLLVTIEIGGEICAGVILLRIGNAYFLRVIAHDSAFNKYSLGMLCCYLGIGECIRRGGTRFHFLFGRQVYKYRLQGKDHAFDALTLYRSWPAAMLSIDVAARIAVVGRAHRIREWWFDPAHRHHPAVRFGRALRNMLRVR